MRYLIGFVCVLALGVVPIGCGGDGGTVDSSVNPSTGCDSGSLDPSVYSHVEISSDGNSRSYELHVGDGRDRGNRSCGGRALDH